MENTNRLGTLSITPTVARQTPRTDFGTVLASAAQQVARTGAGVMASLVPGSPAVSAADRKSTRLNSSHSGESRMPSSA